jgi:hypothetical protein
VSGQIAFFAWPPLTIAAGVLRYLGVGPRDWIVWTAIAVFVIPAAIAGFAFL